MNRKSLLRTSCLVACWAALMCPYAVGQPAALAPTYWKQRQLFIPYQLQQRGKALNPIAKVQLLVSHTGNDDWTTLEEAKPDVQGFSYHAARDGEHWFALRHLDRRGQAWPSDEVVPQVRLVIDTQEPELTLEGSVDATGEAVIRYEARDANLQPETLLLEVRGARNTWTKLPAGELDIWQPARIVGRLRWRPPAGATNIELRAAVADRTGQRTQANETITLSNARSSLQGPTLGRPTDDADAAVGPVENTFESRLASQDWPASNRTPARPQRATPSMSPPISNPYNPVSQAQPPRVSGQLIADGRSATQSVGASRSQSLQITPLDSVSAPPLMTNSSASEANNLWSSASGPQEATSDGAINSQTFDLDYDLQSVGPWGRRSSGTLGQRRRRADVAELGHRSRQSLAGASNGPRLRHLWLPNSGGRSQQRGRDTATARGSTRTQGDRRSAATGGGNLGRPAWQRKPGRSSFRQLDGK